MKIENLADLREIYDVPAGRSLQKELKSLETHSRHFIQLSPFVVLSTRGTNGSLDASPRGGRPGFVHILNDTTLLIPDAKGNNRLDSITNIIETGEVGLLFMIPGVDETLRVNGTAGLHTDADYLTLFESEAKAPVAVIEVKVETLFLHCAKAFMRSELWNPESRISRNDLPPMGKMIHDQLGTGKTYESQEDMIKRYKKDLGI